MSIPENQNRPESLTALAALRLRYLQAKKIRNYSVVLILLVAILGLIASVVDNEDFSHFLPSFVLLVWLIDQQVLKRREAKIKAEAAAIQEHFDCIVLDLPWPTHKGISRPTADRIGQLAGSWGSTGRAPEELVDWYPPSNIPDDSLLAKVYCQRMNCWWDLNLRQEWRSSLKFVFWSFLALLLLLSVVTGITVATLVAIVASNIRILAWGLAENHDQNEAVWRVSRIHRFLSTFSEDNPPSSSDVRSVQDEIFEHRRSNPKVPDWFYWWKREHKEREAGGETSRDTPRP